MLAREPRSFCCLPASWLDSCYYLRPIGFQSLSRTAWAGRHPLATLGIVALPAPVRLDWDHPWLLHHFSLCGSHYPLLHGTSWSRVRESNSPHQLGRLRYYHYTNPALFGCGEWIRTTDLELMRLVFYRFTIPRLLVPLTIMRSLC